MEIKTIEDTDKAIEILLNWALNNKQLMGSLRGSKDSAIRWLTLETAVLDNIPIENINLWDLEPREFIKCRIRDRFFYEMQQRTEMDFGFCKYFKPSWRNLAEYFLSGYKTNPEGNWNLCRYDGKPIWTTCEGTDNDRCVILPRKERKKIDVDEVYSSALRQAGISLKKAKERAIREN